MTKHLIPHHASPFDSIKQVENGHEYWSARNLQTLMGYTEWHKFVDAIDRARLACHNSGQTPADHFVRTAKMVSLGSGSQREVTDYHLTRYAGEGDSPMKQHPRVLGVVPITYYPTLVFSSESAREGTLHPGDYALLYPHWYQATPQGSLQLAGKTAIPARQAPLTNVGGWKRDLESLLQGPLDRRLEARQADLPYVVFLDPDRMSWQEEIPTSFPPDASVYLEPWFYTTDILGRLHALGRFEVQGTATLDDKPSLEEQISRLKNLTGINEQRTIILLEETPL